LKVSDVILKGIGMWLLGLLESIIVFLAFMLGKWTNGLDPAVSILIGSILASSQVLIVLIIKYYFKLPEEIVE